MKNKQISDVVLVYDRYYGNKPDPVLLAARRVILCSAVVMCAMMFVLSEYRLPVNGVLCAVLSALFAAAFALLFIFVKKRIAIPSVLLIAGTLIWLRWESFSEKITYFTDALWLVMSGRFVDGAIFIDHTMWQLSEENPEYISGIMLGVVLLIMLFSMISAAGMFVKPHTLPSFLTWIALWVPVFISETFTFNWWLIPAIALYMGSFASSVAYLQGLTLRSGKGGSYSNAAALNERSFMNRLAKSPYIKRVEMKSAYYSKYFSLTMYAAAIFAAVGLITSAALRDSKGIDYTGLYRFVMSIGERHHITPPPDDDGVINDYFTAPEDSSHLTITSPGKSTREILKVSNPGSMPVYLRGDYGINFFDNDWDTPIINEPELWKVNGDILRERYRPVEMSILQSLLQRDDTLNDTVESIEISVDYLCDTNVVFLPAYAVDYQFYDNEMFRIYGDFSTRVDPEYKKIDRVECTALVGRFSNQDGSRSERGSEYLREAVGAADSYNFSGIMDMFLGDGTVEAYRKYVYGTFLSISDDKAAFMSEFMRSCGLYDTISKLRADMSIGSIETSYRIADAICTYLVENYTYSLDTDDSAADQIKRFLTQTKSGHCALYATSMTLMLRSLGIPARYCTGFVAPPNGSVATILRSRNLHAWCEVYLDELGWVTFDPTSSSLFTFEPGTSDSSSDSKDSSDSDSSSDESSDSSSSASDSESSSDRDSSSSDSRKSSENDSSGEHDVSEPEQPKQSVNIFPYVLIVLAIAAAVALVIAVVSGYRALGRRARKAMRRYCRERKARVILEKIIALLEVGGLSPQSGELPEKFYLRAEKTLRCAFSVNKDLLEAVAFGSRDIPDTECESLSRLLEQLFNALEDKLNVFEKIKLWRAVL